MSLITLLILANKPEDIEIKSWDMATINGKNSNNELCPGVLLWCVCDVIAAGATWQPNKRAGQSRAEHSTPGILANQRRLREPDSNSNSEIRQKGGRLTTIPKSFEGCQSLKPFRCSYCRCVCRCVYPFWRVSVSDLRLAICLLSCQSAMKIFSLAQQTGSTPRHTHHTIQTLTHTVHLTWDSNVKHSAMPPKRHLHKFDAIAVSTNCSNSNSNSNIHSSSSYTPTSPLSLHGNIVCCAVLCLWAPWGSLVLWVDQKFLWRRFHHHH